MREIDINLDYYKRGFITFEELIKMCEDCKVFLRSNETLEQYLLWELYTFN